MSHNDAKPELYPSELIHSK